jgi:hypothetical protein
MDRLLHGRLQWVDVRIVLRRLRRLELFVVRQQRRLELGVVVGRQWLHLRLVVGERFRQLELRIDARGLQLRQWRQGMAAVRVRADPFPLDDRR